MKARKSAWKHTSTREGYQASMRPCYESTEVAKGWIGRHPLWQASMRPCYESTEVGRLCRSYAEAVVASMRPCYESTEVAGRRRPAGAGTCRFNEAVL